RNASATEDGVSRQRHRLAAELPQAPGVVFVPLWTTLPEFEAKRGRPVEAAGLRHVPGRYPRYPLPRPDRRRPPDVGLRLSALRFDVPQVARSHRAQLRRRARG